MVNFPMNLDVRLPNSTVKNVTVGIIYMGYLFIVREVCVEPATHLG